MEPIELLTPTPPPSVHFKTPWKVAIPPAGLVIRLPNWLGDSIMSLPTLIAIRKSNPEARILGLGLRWLAPLFQPFRLFEEFLEIESPQGLKDELALAVFFRRRKGFLTGGMGLNLAGSWRGYFQLRLMGLVPILDPKIRPKIPDFFHFQQHERNRWLQLAGPLLPGSTGDCPPARLEPQPLSSDNLVGQFLRRHQQEQWVGLFLGASFGSAKRYPPENIVSALLGLTRDSGVFFAILGTSSEKNLGAKVMSLIPPSLRNRVRDFTGSTTLRELLEILPLLRGMIANDSGPMHLASLFAVPTLALFGPTDPVATAPLNSQARILRRSLSCSPCKLRHCPLAGHPCMSELPGGRVAQEFLKLLSEVSKQ